MTALTLEAEFGAGLSPRTLRRYECNRQRPPRTAALLAMTLILSLRVSDVLRVLGRWSPERRKFSLTTLVENEHLAGHLPSIDPPPSPEPQDRWQELLETWGGWPTLLSMAHPNLSAHSDDYLLFNPGERFKGLAPLIRDHAVIAMNPLDVSPPKNGAVEKDGWRGRSLPFDIVEKFSVAIWSQTIRTSRSSLIHTPEFHACYFGAAGFKYSDGLLLSLLLFRPHHKHLD